jgi:gentisate 1,2-dioxygenase
MQITDYYEELRRANIAPLWTSYSNLVPIAPRPAAQAGKWSYAEIRPQLVRAGEIVSAEDAERRVLMLLNPDPGIASRAGTTETLYAGIQMVLPGELARAHRHVMSAFRFVIEAEDGASTTVNGQRVTMGPGDLVLTPSWNWHDHYNGSDSPLVWLDGLDLPLVNIFDANFWEPYSAPQQTVSVADNRSTALFRNGRLNPVWEADARSGFSPLFCYRWADTEGALGAALRLGEGTECDGAILEYTNPLTGGPVMPTLNCYVQALAPGMQTSSHRHTTSVIYHVIKGSGVTLVDGEEISWEAHDTFCVPNWAVHSHRNCQLTEPAVLFSYTNQSLYESMGLFREEQAEE